MQSSFKRICGIDSGISEGTPKNKPINKGKAERSGHYGPVNEETFDYMRDTRNSETAIYGGPIIRALVQDNKLVQTLRCVSVSDDRKISRFSR